MATSITNTEGMSAFLDDLAASPYVIRYREAIAEDAELHQVGICECESCRAPQCIAYRHVVARGVS